MSGSRLNHELDNWTGPDRGQEELVTFDGAVIKEQGVTFAVVIVQQHIIEQHSEGNQAIRAFQPLFQGLPVVLMAQDGRGVPTYYGRPDIVNFLAHVPFQAIPWRRYQYN